MDEIWKEVIFCAFGPVYSILGKSDNLYLDRSGGFAVDNPTLMRFFSLHFMLPFLIAGISMVHLLFLHQTGISIRFLPSIFFPKRPFRVFLLYFLFLEEFV